MDEIKGFFAYIVLPFILIVAGLVGGSFMFTNFYGEYKCNNYQRITGKNTKWVAFDACYIETADGWQRWDEYKARILASEGLRK